MAQSFIGRSDLPLGLRNNNPGNIRPGDAWQGMTGTNGGFITFQDVSWGLRALATDLANKINRGLTTIRAIVSTYAPPSENNTAAYIAAVSDDTGIDADQPLSMDASTLHDLVRAIINHENGDHFSTTYISDQDIDQGISMMSNSLQQLFNAAGIALQNPGTPPGLILLAIAGVVLLSSK
jgi:hypothetical protein